MDYFQQSVEESLQSVNSAPIGLTEAEADARLQANGKNKLAEDKKQNIVVKFLKQLADPMIIILLVAAAVSLVLTLVNNANPANEKESFADVIVIAVVVLLNATLGVVQENKAEHAIAALKSMTEAKCKVLRDGKMRFADSCDIVVGDVILLEAGDSVPADCRIIEAAMLKAEESALTGESVPVDKFCEKINSSVPLGDRKNMLFCGSSIAYGRAKAVVVATAMNTEMGKIANVLSAAKEEKTPLQIKMAQLSKVLTYVVIGISVFIFLFKLLMSYVNTGAFAVDVVMDSLLVAIGLAVAAIPEGLATVVTIVLSIGVTNMSKKHAVIRKMTAVETLGCAEIICSDKTGTLTQNKMTVVESFGDDKQLLATGMALCSDAQVSDDQAVGEPTECALVNFALSLGLNKTQLQQQTPRIAEVPFDSLRKMMSTLHQATEDVIQYTKGAPDEIVAHCTAFLQDGKQLPMTEQKRDEILRCNKSMADKALRVLALGMRRYDSLPSDISQQIENDLVFVGLVGMIDPVREEVADAIIRCKNAGIRPIMITGDHIDTAIAIAMQLGIISDASQAVLGSALDEMSDEEFESKISQYSVYARVQPEHKVRIVNTWKKLGKVCAMTGDGVNDAPSIKSADIGVGMGITGTDVTKNTADMILTDDNFATIVTAVGEGRRIYDNIRKAIQFLLSGNLAEVLAVFVSTLCGFTLLRPAHLLWINLITDTLPAVALGTEKAEANVMSRPPRLKKEGIFADGLGVNVVIHGIYVAGITLAAYFVGAHLEGTGWQMSEQGMTMAFVAMSMTEIFHAYNARSMTGSIFALKYQNWLLWGAMALSLALTTAVIYIPGLNTAFGFAALSATEYFSALALAFSIIPLVEAQKLATSLARRHSHNVK